MRLRGQTQTATDSQSQPSSRNAPSTSRQDEDDTQLTQKIERAKNEDHAKEIAQYLLCCSSKKGCVKQAELRKAFSFITPSDMKQYLCDVDKRYQESLGCRVLSNGTRTCIINPTKDAPEDSVADKAHALDEAKNGLLFLVLMYMFMVSEETVTTDTPPSVTDDQLWRFLERFGLSKDKSDFYLGDVNKLLGPSNSSEFVSKGFLTLRKEPGHSETVSHIYGWGPNAELFISARDVMKLYCQIMEEDIPKNSWPKKHAQALTMRETQKEIVQSSTLNRERQE